MPFPWSAGQILTATDLNASLGGDTATTWSSPIAGGITVGSGTTTASYRRFGDLVICTFNFTMGAGSAITGEVSLTTPLTMNAFLGGSALYTDTGTATYAGVLMNSGTTTILVRIFQVSTAQPSIVALSSTVPHTWGNTDVISATVIFFVA